jgi:hypothetical protein
MLNLSMGKPKRILFYGDTLVLAGVRASLESETYFQVINHSHGNVDIKSLLKLSPDIVIYDSGSVQSEFLETLFHHKSDLVLIGINPENNQVRVWAGHHLSGLSIVDLVRVIDRQAWFEVSSQVGDAAPPL